MSSTSSKVLRADKVWLDGKIVRMAPEYEDVRAAALKHGVPLSVVHRAAAEAR